ncbi:hypothetical protein [Marilutibacter alkalisoli]|uniref:Uncharacterized protein n=1 Tax=Marilutibacter alkalisoli TaxID=2591633 RepID=A0A514BW03_9GAMM|nr:hypothetical protein [Lysobacter alkalisoli]QDH71584.1 hypothetical protein FKV23_16890 [Lysobacter alkalisoli]
MKSGWNMRRRSGRWLLPALFCLMAVPAVAEDGPPAPTAFTLHATMVGDNPYHGGYDTTPYPVTLYARGKSTRVDFTGPADERGMLLHEADTRSGWLVSLNEGIAIPLDAPGLGELVVEPERPCQRMQARCQPAGNRYVAGRVVKGWRYRNADGRGPAGTSSGELWVDPEHGVILAYSGKKQGWDRRYEMEAMAVTYGPLSELLFELPESVAVPNEGERL